jgi:hypothetical protein
MILTRTNNTIQFRTSNAEFIGVGLLNFRTGMILYDYLIHDYITCGYAVNSVSHEKNNNYIFYI